jgi:hypothetical protein
VAIWFSGRATSLSMEDPETIIHATGHTMTVVRENFEAAIKRIGWLYEQPTGYRRPVT